MVTIVATKNAVWCSHTCLVMKHVRHKVWCYRCYHNCRGKHGKPNNTTQTCNEDCDTGHGVTVIVIRYAIMYTFLLTVSLTCLVERQFAVRSIVFVALNIKTLSTNACDAPVDAISH
uniref:Uncharacterized protein n=1 Tax=Lygus hesperus TaxID=30085 RepID=A0A146L5U0_LYGHE